MSTTTHERRAFIGLAAAGLLMAGLPLRDAASARRSGAGSDDALAGVFQSVCLDGGART